MTDSNPAPSLGARLVEMGRQVDAVVADGSPRAALRSCAGAAGQVQSAVWAVLRRLDAGGDDDADGSTAAVQSLAGEAVDRLGEASSRLHAAARAARRGA